MRPYEVVIIIDVALDDAANEAFVRRHVDLVSSRGGTVDRVDRWGRRRLAYELHHKTDGYYVLLNLRAEPAVMDELDRSLRLADEAIRHKIVRLPDHVAGRAPRNLRATEAEGTPATATT